MTPTVTSTTFLDRGTKSRISTTSITAPQYRIDREKLRETGDERKSRYPVLSFVDRAGFHKHLPISAEMYSRTAGQNLVRSKPDGFDRLRDHLFILHLAPQGPEDKGKIGKDRVVGIDVIPSRMRSSKVVLTKDDGIETLILSWDGTGIVQVTQRPHNLKAERVAALIKVLDTKFTGNDLPVGQMVSKTVRCEATGLGRAEFRFLAGEGGASPAYEDVDIDNQI